MQLTPQFVVGSRFYACLYYLQVFKGLDEKLSWKSRETIILIIMQWDIFMLSLLIHSLLLFYQSSGFVCNQHVRYWGWGWCLETGLSPPPLVIHYWPFQGGSSDAGFCCLYLVSEFRWCFTLCLFTIPLVRFRLLRDHLLWNSCPHGWPFVLILFVYLWFWLFPILVLIAGFAFWLS